MNSIPLVPTQRVGTVSARAAGRDMAQRVETVFPRSALIVIHKCRHTRRERVSSAMDGKLRAIPASWVPAIHAEMTKDVYNDEGSAWERVGSCFLVRLSGVHRSAEHILPPFEKGGLGGIFSKIALALILLFTSCRVAAETMDHAGHASPPATAANGSNNTMTISSERLQAIGVKFEAAARRDVKKTIRTVGRVEMDERRLARVNIKLEGWIDELYVNTTGEKVKKGQLLFTLYSPELVATQEEYLLAVRAAKTLGKSEFPEVAEGARSILDVSRRRLQLWDVEDYHIEELERSGKVLKTLPFHAPLSGTVIEKTAVAGMRVMPGEVLYTIADLSKIWVVADIYEYELPLVRIGQDARVSLSYAPQILFSGSISFIYPTVDPETRTAKVRIELDNPKEVLKPGMYANVEVSVPLGTRLAVSKDAVLESGERQIIFIHHGGGRLEWRNVKIGLRSGDWVEILEGLKEGEHIVTSANFLLDSESQLKSAVGGMAGMKH